MNKLLAFLRLKESASRRTINVDIIIKTYKIDQAIGNTMFGGVKNGFSTPSYHSFMPEWVKTEQILTGEFIAVRDESSKILFYVNPKRLSLNSLLNELNSKANLERTNEARRHNLLEQGYQEAINGVVKIEDIEEEQYYYAKPNRNRQFVKSQKHKTKRY